MIVRILTVKFIFIFYNFTWIFRSWRHRSFPYNWTLSGKTGNHSNSFLFESRWHRQGRPFLLTSDLTPRPFLLSALPNYNFLFPAHLSNAVLAAHRWMRKLQFNVVVGPAQERPLPSSYTTCVWSLSKSRTSPYVGQHGIGEDE